LFVVCRLVFHQSLINYIIDYRGLNIIEETDRKGRRVFCAKFDRNPKWSHRYNMTAPELIPATELPTRDDDESIQLVSRFYFGDDEKYSNEEDTIHESYPSFEDYNDN